MNHLYGEDMLRFLIVRQSLLKRLFNIGDEFLFCLALNERTYGLAHLQVLLQHLWRCIKKDGLATRVHIVHVIEETGGSSTTRDDDILKLSYLMEHLLFHLTKTFLTLRSKDVRNFLMETILNVVVEVVELESHLTSKLLFDSL